MQTPLLGEEELCRMLESRKNPLVLVLDGLQDPHNLGACLRTADACGVDAVVVPKDRAAPMTETVRRVACGGAEHTPLSRVTNLARCLRRLRDCGLRVVGTSDAAATPLWEADLTGPLALAMGAEGQGLRRLTTEICDSLVHIPMTPGAGVECLNVSVAAGVCLFEAKRQRCMR